MDLGWAGSQRGHKGCCNLLKILVLSTLSTQELLILLLLHTGACKSLKLLRSSLGRARGVISGVTRGYCDLIKILDLSTLSNQELLILLLLHTGACKSLKLLRSSLGRS